MQQWVEVPVYAVAVSMYPIRSSYRYLKKLHKYHYLRRGRDIRGRIVYRLFTSGREMAFERPAHQDVKGRGARTVQIRWVAAFLI